MTFNNGLTDWQANMYFIYKISIYVCKVKTRQITKSLNILELGVKDEWCGCTSLKILFACRSFYTNKLWRMPRS